MNCQCCPQIETSHLICCANQLTGFYMKATMALNGLKYKKEWSILFIFLLKITSRVCFLGSGLNLTFHWKSQSLIFIKSLFRSFAAESLYFERRRTEGCYPFVSSEVSSSNPGLHLYFRRAVMKSYPFATLCWVNKNKNT